MNDAGIHAMTGVFHGVKGDLEGFSSAQHDFDETLPNGDWNLIGKARVKKNPGLPNGDPGFHCQNLRLG